MSPDLLDRITAYESAELDAEETVELFAELIRTGLAWTLQGHYGRVAASLMGKGLIDMYGNVTIERSVT